MVVSTCFFLLFDSFLQVSVVSLFLHGIEASVCVNNRDIAVDSIVSDFALKERGNMTLEKFQEFFISGWNHQQAPTFTHILYLSVHY